MNYCILFKNAGSQKNWFPISGLGTHNREAGAAKRKVPSRSLGTSVFIIVLPYLLNKIRIIASWVQPDFEEMDKIWCKLF